MRTGTGTDQIWAREEGETQDTENTDLTLLPPPERLRPAHHPTGRGGGGRSGGLKDTETGTGQEASRAAPVPEAMAERGARAAMAGQGTRGAMADPRTQEALAGQGTREAMVVSGNSGGLGGSGDLRGHGGSGNSGGHGGSGELGWPGWIQGLRRPWWIRGLGRPWAERGAWEAMAGSPPPKFSWGNSPAGTLESRTEPGRGSGEPDGAGMGSWEPDGTGRGSGEPDGAGRGLWRAGRNRHGLWRAGRSRHRRTLAWSRQLAERCEEPALEDALAAQRLAGGATGSANSRGALGKRELSGALGKRQSLGGARGSAELEGELGGTSGRHQWAWMGTSGDTSGLDGPTETKMSCFRLGTGNFPRHRKIPSPIQSRGFGRSMGTFGKRPWANRWRMVRVVASPSPPRARRIPRQNSTKGRSRRLRQGRWRRTPSPRRKRIESFRSSLLSRCCHGGARMWRRWTSFTHLLEYKGRWSTGNTSREWR